MAKQQWKIDPSHSGVHFSVRHMVVSKTRGHFSKFDGELQFDEQSPAAGSVKVRIDAASIVTNDAKRDEHLRSADFFDAAKFPQLTFESRRIEPKGKQGLLISGDLTIRGVKREVTLEAEYLGAQNDPWGNRRAGFAARTTIDRKDYGLTWNQLLETGGLLVADKVEIELEVEAVAQKATAEKAA